MSHQAEHRRRFKAVLCANPITYQQLKEQRKQQDRGLSRDLTASVPPPASLMDQSMEEETLDGFFLVSTL